LPTTTMTIANQLNIDTKGSMCAPEFATVCVIAATSIEIDTIVTAQGNRPLVLIATGSLHVAASGIVDVASHHNGQKGAGQGNFPCDIGQNPNQAGGGQGGSFGGDGGNGGDGTGQGGRAGATMIPTTLRAGCDGQDGGGAGGSNGNGGGAVYLI